MKGKLLKPFYESCVVKNKLPVNYSEKDAFIFANHLTINLPFSGLYQLNHVLVTDIGVVYKNFYAIKENITCYDLDFKNYRFRYLIKTLLNYKKFRYRGQPCVLIFDNYSGPNGFAHWICDGLTRLAEMNTSLKNYTLIVPEYFKDQKIYTDTLSLFNISSIHYLKKNSLTFFKELNLPLHIGDTGNFHPQNIEKLRQIVLPQINTSHSSKKNIYISRAKASRRFVKNEPELIAALSQFGFETIYMEDYDFLAQVALINHAENIISIHGAALSMLLFATKNANILELRNQSDNINNMYYLLANVTGLNYYYLHCESFENTKSANNFDLIVNVTELEKNVKLMMVSPNN